LSGLPLEPARCRRAAGLWRLVSKGQRCTQPIGCLGCEFHERELSAQFAPDRRWSCRRRRVRGGDTWDDETSTRGLSLSRASFEMCEGHCGWRHRSRGGNTLGVAAQEARFESVEGIVRDVREPLWMASSLSRWQHLGCGGAGSAVRVRRGHRSRRARAIVDGVIALGVATPWVRGRRKHGLSSSRASLEMHDGHCGWRCCTRGGNTLGVGTQKAWS
jgi:hypothetical protein